MARGVPPPNADTAATALAAARLSTSQITLMAAPGVFRKARANCPPRLLTPIKRDAHAVGGCTGLGANGRGCRSDRWNDETRAETGGGRLQERTTIEGMGHGGYTITLNA